MKMKLKQEGIASISDAWWRLDVKDSIINVMLFVAYLLIYPIMRIYVWVKKMFSKTVSKQV